MYVFPRLHPVCLSHILRLPNFHCGVQSDRQSQVGLQFDSPDFSLFPAFRGVQVLEAVLNPGDVLLMPVRAHLSLSCKRV